MQVFSSEVYKYFDTSCSKERLWVAASVQISLTLHLLNARKMNLNYLLLPSFHFLHKVGFKK